MRADLREPPNLLLADGRVVLQSQAVWAERRYQFPHPCARRKVGVTIQGLRFDV